MPEYQIVKQTLNRNDRVTGAITFRHRTIPQKFRDIGDARVEAKRMARNIDDEQFETIYIVEKNDERTVETWVRRNGAVKTII